VHGNLEISSDLKELENNAFIETLARRSADPYFHLRTVNIEVNYDGSRCEWSIWDQGQGFDVERVLARFGSQEFIELASGRGILLMRTFMDEVRYEDGGRRLILVMEQDSGNERRRERRMPLLARLQVTPIHADGSIDWTAASAAVARNLTREGIGILQNQLTKTDRIVIGLWADEKPVYIPAEVRHWRALGGDMVELGCRFLPEAVSHLGRAPTKEVAAAIGRLLERTQASVSRDDERRTNARALFTERIEILTSPEQPPLVGYSRDLSKGGIAFLTTAALPREVTLVFAPTGNEPPLHVRAEIIRCARVQDGFYDVGGRFRGLVQSAKPKSSID
jgi:hypothetical protein